MENSYDKMRFNINFDNFVNSDYAKDKIILIDKWIARLGFEIPQHYNNVIQCSIDDCFKLVNRSSEFICLAIGTSACFPELDLNKIKRDKSYFAELHCTCWGEIFSASFTLHDCIRISLYRFDGHNKDRDLIARYEKGKEILESSINPGDELLEISNYSSPGGWKNDCRAEGIGVPLPMCHGLTQTMKKYNITFPEAYKLLTDNGGIITEGEMPIYHMAADRLWMDDPGEEETIQPLMYTRDEKLKEGETIQPSIYTRDEKLKCEFLNLIIRNESLEKKYKGGVKLFTRRHLCRYNDDLTIISAIGYDFDDVIDDLRMAKLEPEDDYLVLDVGFGPASHIYNGVFVKGGEFPISMNELRTDAKDEAEDRLINIYGYKWIKGYDDGKNFTVSVNMKASNQQLKEDI